MILMDQSDCRNSCLFEETTHVIIDAATSAACRKRMEIRRFKRISYPLTHSKSLNLVNPGSFKRTRPLNGNLSLKDHGNECVSELVNGNDVSIPSGLISKLKDANGFEQSTGSGLVRSKSCPPQRWRNDKCVFHISATRHVSAAPNVEVTVNETADVDVALNNTLESPPDYSSWTAEITETLHSSDIQSSSKNGQQKLEGALLSSEANGNTTSLECEILGASVLLGFDKEVGDYNGVGQVDTNMLKRKSSTEQNKCPPSGKLLFCGRRAEMEDAAVIVPSFYQIPCISACNNQTTVKLCNLHFFGVYDGHGGSQASNFCAGRLHHALSEELSSHNDIVDTSSWKKVMAASFLKVDKEVGGICPNEACYDLDTTGSCCVGSIAPENVGTTAVIAVVSPSQIIVANCGDSRAVLSQGGKAIPLSEDHKPERDDETCRIEAAGGRVIYWDGYRVGGLLAMSRAIGDRYLKRYVISEPDVVCLERTVEDECLILASDGLWDVITNETACDVARRYLANAHKKGDQATAPASAAALLVKMAYQRGSKDNISVLVVDLRSTEI